MVVPDCCQWSRINNQINLIAWGCVVFWSKPTAKQFTHFLVVLELLFALYFTCRVLIFWLLVIDTIGNEVFMTLVHDFRFAGMVLPLNDKMGVQVNSCCVCHQ